MQRTELLFISIDVFPSFVDQWWAVVSDIVAHANSFVVKNNSNEFSFH